MGEWYGKRERGSGRGTTLYYVCTWLPKDGNSFSIVDVNDKQEATMAQITLTQEEAAALRGALSSYVSDLRMEIADTDSWQFRQNLKREALLLKRLLEQLDAELALAGTSS
jgi:hypothetical protein